MLPFLNRIAYKLRLKKKPKVPPKSFLPWDKVERVALIIGNESELNKSAIDRFVSETKKFVEIFFIETKSKVATYKDWNCFIRKDRSFFNLPTKDVESVLKEKNFDLVINTCSSHNLFSAAISNALHAPFKCACSSRFHDANLVVRRTSPHLDSYLNDTLHYLKMIKV